jgi:hypothetical protein
VQRRGRRHALGRKMGSVKRRTLDGLSRGYELRLELQREAQDSVAYVNVGAGGAPQVSVFVRLCY